MKRNPQTAVWSAALLAALLIAPTLRASEPSLLTDSFYISLGTYTVGSDTEVQLDGEAGTGTLVDLEQTFGDDDSTRFRLDTWWRFAERHKIRAMWFDSNADASRILDEEISWGDETFPVGVDARLEREFSIYELAYEYSFVRRPTWELTGSIGLHYTQLEIVLSAELEIDGEPGETRSAADSASLDAPLPVVGFRFLWNPAGKFWIDASAQYFSLSIDEYDGRVTDFRLAALWQPRRWLGVGAGYNSFNVDVDVERSSFAGSLDWGYSGPQFFVSGSF